MLKTPSMSIFLVLTVCSAISEEVSYSQSTDSEHEEEHEEDVIQQKEASFNH